MRYPPLPGPNSVGQAPGPSARERELIEMSQALGDFFRYSGYYQTGEQNSMPERYSDRYRRIVGCRELFDEIVEPSLLVFPPELLAGLSKRPPTLHSAAKFVPTTAADAQNGPVDEESAARLMEHPLNAEGEAAAEDKADDDEVEVEDVVEEEDDEMGGGDYTEKYSDDDENDGGMAFGNDDEDVF